MAAPKKAMITSKTIQKTEKKVDYKALDRKELTKLLVKLREEATTLKRNSLIGDVQNVHAYIYKRRDIARILTALNSKPTKKAEE